MGVGNNERSLNKEFWKEIVGYKGKYKISNTGKIKNTKTGNLIRGYINKYGYTEIILRQGKPLLAKKYYLHRLLALHFIDNPNNLKVVDHIDNNPKNNSLDNLQWVSYSKNVSKALDSKLYKKIKVTNLNTNEQNIYPSLRQAAKACKLNYNTVRNNLFYGKQIMKGLYKFEYLGTCNDYGK